MRDPYDGRSTKSEERTAKSLAIGPSLALRALFGMVLMGTAGCPPEGPRGVGPVELLTRDQAITVVNGNARLLQAGLRSNGLEVRAELPVEGQKRRFDLRGNLGFLKPKFFYLLLSHSLVADPVMRIGSNDREYWVWVKADINKLWLGQREDLSSVHEELIPVHPDQLIESLGLNELPEGVDLDGPFFTVQEERNQVLFVRFDSRDRPYVSKEYWLDRRAPFLVRRIVFRRPDGTVGMQTYLEDYRELGEGARVAHHVRIEWPEKDGYMDLRLSKVVVWEKLTASHPFFQPPQGVDTVQRIGSGL